MLKLPMWAGAKYIYLLRYGFLLLNFQARSMAAGIVYRARASNLKRTRSRWSERSREACSPSAWQRWRARGSKTGMCPYAPLQPGGGHSVSSQRRTRSRWSERSREACSPPAWQRWRARGSKTGIKVFDIFWRNRRGGAQFLTCMVFGFWQSEDHQVEIKERGLKIGTAQKIFD